jgi:hypothetical protein
MRDDITTSPSIEYREPVISDEELSKTIMEKVLLSNLNNPRQSGTMNSGIVTDGLSL